MKIQVPETGKAKKWKQFLKLEVNYDFSSSSEAHTSGPERNGFSDTSIFLGVGEEALDP